MSRIFIHIIDNFQKICYHILSKQDTIIEKGFKMNEILNNILTRRSIRRFNQKKIIPNEELENIVTAGMFAPTARNRQLTLFTVVTNKEIIMKLANAVGKALQMSNYDFYMPTAIIITSCPRESKFVKEDTSCALENMFLYAHSIGVGSVWINQLVVTCDDSGVREILNELEIPADHVCGGMAALGYADEDCSERDLTRKTRVRYFK